MNFQNFNPVFAHFARHLLDNAPSAIGTTHHCQRCHCHGRRASSCPRAQRAVLLGTSVTAPPAPSHPSSTRRLRSSSPAPPPARQGHRGCPGHRRRKKGRTRRLAMPPLPPPPCASGCGARRHAQKQFCVQRVASSRGAPRQGAAGGNYFHASRQLASANTPAA